MGDLPIKKLIDSRCADLGISRAALIAHTGLRNREKAHRRLDALCAGKFQKTRSLIDALPTALELTPNVIAAAIEITRQELEEDARAETERAERSYRASFRPHAVLITEHDRPHPVFVAALIGVESLLRIDFDLSCPRSTFVRQTLAAIQRKPVVPCFGRVIGFVINYAPERAVRFTATGEALEMMRKAVGLQEAGLSLGKERRASLIDVISPSA